MAYKQVSPIPVIEGGTQFQSATAYAVICGGVTSTSALQPLATLGAAGTVLTSNGPGALPSFLPSSGGGITWTVISANQTAAVGNGYFCNKASALSLALPASSNVGDIIEVTNENVALGVIITQIAGQQILLGNSSGSTTVGVTGTLSSSQVGDTLKLVCKVANFTWRAVEAIGNWTNV